MIPDPAIDPAPVIDSEQDVERSLSDPRPELVDFIRRVPSPLIVLGAGGKMGPTLAVLARRAAEAASHPLEVIAVSRFSDSRARSWLDENGVRTHPADLLEASAVAALPAAPSVIYLVGLKFGTAQNPALTWAVNTLVPARVAEHYRDSRIVALSTGNVYPMVPVASRGATEDHPLTPLGEYANAAVARERIFQFVAGRQATPLALLRLNYAVEWRYGVLVDIARTVIAGQPVDVTNGFFNCIWQADANEMIIRSLALAAAPARSWNLTAPGLIAVRDVAQRFADMFRRPLTTIGSESSTALISDPSALCSALGPPPTSLDVMIERIARWVEAGGRFLGKPTHFETRDGVY